MREIKFRAWDKKRKELFRVHDLNFNRHDGTPTTIMGYTPDSGNCWNVFGGHFMKYANEERYVLMQFTGLKDKNGKEIYEGDVVIREMISGFSINEDFIGEVKMNECRWWIDNGQDAIPLWDEVDELKIIGNIYENPELLGDLN
ncbi:YopX family protein [Lysinibacillus xylanilyticus]|uniref:YopX family protein n=1 Tax=Lysinibacillus xylanilyticus TaxID=582475 RepID=UPI0038059F7B